MDKREPVLILGAGELGSAAAYRLRGAGFDVVMTELPAPTMLRSAVSYGTAAQHGAAVVAGICSRRAVVAQVQAFLQEGVIPILIDAAGESVAVLQPRVLIDGRGAGKGQPVHHRGALLTIRLGDELTAHGDYHAVITPALPTVPEPIYLAAPIDGIMQPCTTIAQPVRAGDRVGMVGDAPLTAPCNGVIWGLLDSDVTIGAGDSVAAIAEDMSRHACLLMTVQALAAGDRVVELVTGSLAVS